MKEFSKTKPRWVAYCSDAEMKASKIKATQAGLKTSNQWVASVIRKALAAK